MSITITKKIDSHSVKTELSQQIEGARTRYHDAQATIAATPNPTDILDQAHDRANAITASINAKAAKVRRDADNEKAAKVRLRTQKRSQLSQLEAELKQKQAGLTVARELGKIIRPRNRFDLMWKDRGSGAKVDLSIYRNEHLSGTRRLGHFAIPSYTSVHKKYSVMVFNTSNPIVKWKWAKGFKLVWKDSGSGASWDGSIWKPIPPSGYSYMGMVANRGYGKPSKYNAICVETKYTKLVYADKLVWNDRGSGADRDVSLWYNKQLGTFWAHASHRKPGRVIRIFDVAKIEAEVRRRANL